jgi:nucleoid DNA-binding protein
MSDTTATLSPRDTWIESARSKMAANGIAVNKTETAAIINAVVEAMGEVAQSTGSLMTKVGTLKWKHNAARTAKNPKTGEAVQVEAFANFALTAHKSTRIYADGAKAPVATKTEAEVANKPRLLRR